MASDFQLSMKFQLPFLQIGLIISTKKNELHLIYKRQNIFTTKFPTSLLIYTLNSERPTACESYLQMKNHSKHRYGNTTVQGSYKKNGNKADLIINFQI